MGVDERKHRDRERRIKEILAASRMLFLNKGLIHTTMMEIAERSDLSRRTLYQYFTSKDQIALRLVYDGLCNIKQRLINNTLNKASGFEQLEGMKEAYLSFYHDDFDAFHSTFKIDTLISEENIESEDVKKCLVVMQEISDLISSALYMGIEDGSIQPQDDLKGTAVSLMNIVHSSMDKISTRGFIFRKITSRSGEDILLSMFSLLLSGLKK